MLMLCKIHVNCSNLPVKFSVDIHSKLKVLSKLALKNIEQTFKKNFVQRMKFVVMFNALQPGNLQYYTRVSSIYHAYITCKLVEEVGE